MSVSFKDDHIGLGSDSIVRLQSCPESVKGNAGVDSSSLQSDSIVGYRPKPLNCSLPKLARQIKHSSNDSLFKLMKDWESHVCPDGDLPIDDFGKIDNNTVGYTLDLVANLTPSLDEIHSTLLTHQSDLPTKIGFFVSALYRKLPQRVISFDLQLETPLSGIDWLLCDKILVIRAPVESLSIFPDESLIDSDNPFLVPRTYIINYSQIEILSCVRSRFIVNFGNVRLAIYFINASLLNFGGNIDKVYANNVYDIGSKGFESLHQGIALFVESCFESDAGGHKIVPIKELIQHPSVIDYFSDLRNRFEAGRIDDAKAENAIAYLGENPSNTVLSKTFDLLRGIGYVF